MTDPQQPASPIPPVPPVPVPPVELTFDPPTAVPAPPAAAPVPAPPATPDPLNAPAPHWSATAPPAVGAPVVPGAPAPLAPALPTAYPVAAGYGAAQPTYGTPPQGYGAPTGYAAPAGAYAAPVGGYTQGYGGAAAPAPANSRTLGTVALILALIAAVVTSIVGAYATFEIGRNALSVESLNRYAGTYDGDSLLSLLTPVRGFVLMLEISFWAGTVLGIWAIVQGIIATVKRRGRGWGIAAIIIAVLGPAIYFTVLWTTFIVGAASAGI